MLIYHMTFYLRALDVHIVLFQAVHFGMTQKCHYCGRYGATIKCRAYKCERFFHYPCAAGSGCYQVCSLLLFDLQRVLY